MSALPVDQWTLYERDMRDQPQALRLQVATPLPEQLRRLEIRRYARMILTGMGSSHSAAIPLWRSFIASGLPAWWVSATQLMDSPDLITPDSLMIATSQSGRSGEIVAATAGGLPRPAMLIGVTNDPVSPLGGVADICLQLGSGDEATVSSKSYLNTLAAHRRLGSVLLGQDIAPVETDILHSADDLEDFDCSDIAGKVAVNTIKQVAPRVALVGKGDDAATALLGGLVLKEAAKVSAEGFIGGDFRHGPLEIAGPGLTAVLLSAAAAGAAIDPSLRALAHELAGTGSQVLIIGSGGDQGQPTISLPARSEFGRRVLATKTIQVLSVELAKAKGIVPGAFLFGQKITSTL